MTILSLITSAILTFVPVVDGSRVVLDHETDLPYLLGITSPFECDVLITGGDFRIEMDNFRGDYEVGMMDIPLDFYCDGEYIGQISPEPATACFLFGGIILFRKMKGFRK